MGKMMNAKILALRGLGGPDKPKASLHDIEQELQRVLLSKQFCKAHSSRRMLQFLVEQVQNDRPRETSEYAIGMAVFARDAATYSTGDDPIVRVQAGRVRHKLAAYYSGDGLSNPFRITIPLGSYQVRIDASASEASTARLVFQPLACISEQSMARLFTLGLNEELSFRLFRDFGQRVASGVCESSTAALLRERAISYVLEGSVRQDGSGFRTVLRLLDLAGDCVTWSAQHDHGLDLSIACQEQLALDCCSALQRHFAGSHEDEV
jgi:TolB-like protein